MSRSTYEWTPLRGSKLATFYDVDSTPGPHFRFASLAATSLYASVADLARFMTAQVPGADGEPAGRGVLSPESVEQMWQSRGAKLGQDIWGLGTMLFATNEAGGFVVGHDGNNEPAINTAARLNPATANGFVMLETGNPLLATILASEWVFWETDQVDFLALTIEADEMLRTVAVSWIAILVLPVLLRLRRFVEQRATSPADR